MKFHALKRSRDNQFNQILRLEQDNADKTHRINDQNRRINVQNRRINAQNREMDELRAQFDLQAGNMANITAQLDQLRAQFGAQPGNCQTHTKRLNACKDCVKKYSNLFNSTFSDL